MMGNIRRGRKVTPQMNRYDARCGSRSGCNGSVFPVSLLLCSMTVMEGGRVGVHSLQLQLNVANHACHKPRKSRRDGATILNRGRCRSRRCNHAYDCIRINRGHRSLDLRLMGSSSDITATDNSTDLDQSSVADQLYLDSNSTLSRNRQTTKWKANNFEEDYSLMQTAMKRQSAKDDLRALQRKHVLDYGFARNRRPLLRDALTSIGVVGALAVFILSGIRAASEASLHGRCKLRQLHVAAATAMCTMSNLHHWMVNVSLPLLMLVCLRYRPKVLGPSARILDDYFQSKSSISEPSFFYTNVEYNKRRAREKDTGDYALCLLENWSSAAILPFVYGLYSALFALLRTKRLSLMMSTSSVSLYSRLLTRLGIAASLHQYPSLLFELRRSDQPRPLCGSTTRMQRAVKGVLRWLPIGMAVDLAMILGPQTQGAAATVKLGTVASIAVSTIGSLCHLIALLKIVRVTKCTAVSLSESTTFPMTDQHDAIDTANDKYRRKRIWRYQLKWRTPRRIKETLKTWTGYFFTGHKSLTDDEHLIGFDDYSTEGSHLSSGDNSEAFDMTPHADTILESLSVILRDRDAAITNATQVRYDKHQESYDSKTLDDVLGVAVQRTFDIGLSYDFDHYDVPADGEEISIHQLRARMAKSAVRRKKDLDNTMRNELDVLYRLKENVITAANREIAEEEMHSLEDEIRSRHDNEVDRMRQTLLTLIPTNAKDVPKGTERYDNPIIIAEYVNLTAPFDQGSGEFETSIGNAPDTLEMIEDYVRRDFGDEAADAYRKDEIAARRKEYELLSQVSRER